MLQNLALKATYLHFSMVMEDIVVLLVDSGPNLTFVLMLTSKLKILAPSWAIFDAPIHLTSPPAWGTN
jgi:hypothetical protein